MLPLSLKYTKDANDLEKLTVEHNLELNTCIVLVRKQFISRKHVELMKEEIVVMRIIIKEFRDSFRTGSKSGLEIFGDCHRLKNKTIGNSDSRL